MTALPRVREVRTFDALVERFRGRETSFTEAESLEHSHWSHGEDARLREDPRFRPTPWSRWMLSETFLANEAVRREMARARRTEVLLSEALAGVSQVVGMPCVLCTGDPRVVVSGDVVRLASSELSREPLVEDASDLEKFATHLPLHTLRAAAACEAEGQWGPRAHEEAIETLGWLRVELPGGRRLNDRMFLARIEGHSMDDGRRGLVDGALAVFELWPKGDRNGKELLVRGSFSDPETGTYALKRYAPEPRDQDRERETVRLVSLNSDKERYPDIVLRSQSEDDLEVVAELLTALDPASYARAPRQPRRKGRRDLESEAGRAEVAERLGRQARNFFGDSDRSERVPGEREVPLARLVCLTYAEGGPQIEVDPLADLVPPFVKRLQVGTSSWSRTELASNLRHRRWCVPVEPGAEGYRWSAAGQEDLLAEELERLFVPGLSTEHATPFKVDARGTGRAVSRDQLASGREYRVLVPPGLTASRPELGDWHELQSGWRQWDVTIPSPVSGETSLSLERLGLGRGHEAPGVEWVVQPPVEYREGAGGEPYPCFESSAPPVVRVRSKRTHLEGELSLFLWSPDETAQLALPPGEEWFVELGPLSEGNYLLQVLHSRTRFLPDQLPFAVTSSTPEPVQGKAEVTGSGCTVHETDAGLVRVEADLTSPGTTIEIRVPPLWPVELSWRAGYSEQLGPLVASTAGVVSTDEILERLGPRVSASRAGDVVLGLRDLGRVVLAHTRRPGLEEVRQGLGELVSVRASSAEELRGEFLLLEKTWLQPLLQLLGFETELIDRTEGERIAEAAPFVLFETRRSAPGEVVREPSALLLVTGRKVDLARDEEVRRLADDLCAGHGLRRALLTDGLLWTKHRRDSRLHGRVWDVRELVSDDASAELEAFLLDFAVGV